MPFPKQTHQQNAAFVEEVEGTSHEEHRIGIRCRGDDGRDDGDQEDGILPVPGEEGDIDKASPGQKEQDQGELKDHTEGEEEEEIEG